MKKRSIAIMILAAVTVLGRAPHGWAHGPVEGERANSLMRLADDANLVFVGDVTDIAYRKARIEGGDGELPYTIVTYAIRKVLRGQAPGESFTMRFPGGPDGRGHFMEVTGVPVFQRGEQDVLFVVGNGEKGCPLVDCEWGRFRILKEAVYNTHGSPVRGLIELHAIARGLPAEEFRRFSYPTPSFDELIKNPEAQKILKDRGLSLEEARKRYATEAPKQIEVRAVFPETARKGSDARDSEQRIASQPNPRVTAPGQEVTLAQGPVALTQFLGAVNQAVAKSRRAPAGLKSIDQNAEIVVRLAPVIPPTRAQSKAAASTKTAQEEAELKALAAQSFNPVLKH